MKILKKLFLLFIASFTLHSLPAMAENGVTNLSIPINISHILSTSNSWEGSSLPGFNTGVSELQVLTYKIIPGAKTAIHLHPLNGAGYMLSGELTMYATSDPKGSFNDPKKIKKIQLKAGDAWAEAVNIWHYGQNNGKEDVNFVLVFAGPKGTPATLSVP